MYERTGPRGKCASLSIYVCRYIHVPVAYSIVLRVGGFHVRVHVPHLSASFPSSPLLGGVYSRSYRPLSPARLSHPQEPTNVSKVYLWRNTVHGCFISYLGHVLMHVHEALPRGKTAGIAVRSLFFVYTE